MFIKALKNGFNKLSLCSSKAFRGMEYGSDRQCCRKNQTVTFEQLVE